jgi:NADPH:quinone reductase
VASQLKAHGERADPPAIAAHDRPTGRTIVIDGPRRARIATVGLPRPLAGEVRVELEGCGICASNIPVWEGRDWFRYPLDPGAPGHEGWGFVESAGEGVDSVQPGDRVAVLSHHALASFDIAPVAQVVPLPAPLFGRAFPAEPIGCAFNVVRRSGVVPGEDVAVIGIGFLGAIVTRLVASTGARVIAISRRAFALDVARQFGAAETVQLGDHAGVIEAVRELTDGRWCHCVIEATGLQGPLDVAGEIAAERGRLVVAGFHQDGPRRVNMQLWNWRGLDVINAHERDPREYVRGMREAIDAVARGDLDPDPLYTHRFPLERAGEALEMSVSRPEGFMKALVCT